MLKWQLYDSIVDAADGLPGFTITPMLVLIMIKMMAMVRFYDQDYNDADDADDHDDHDDGDVLIVRLEAVIALRSPADRVTC